MSTQPTSIAMPLADLVAPAWRRAARDAQRVPPRRDIDLRMLGDALPWSFILSRHGRETGRFRVAGGSVSTCLGVEPAGVSLAELIRPQDRGLVGLILRRLFDTPAPVRLQVTDHTPGSTRTQIGALSLWPLADDAGHVTRALGVLDLPTSRPALRLGIDDWTVEDRPYPARPARETAPAPAFAEAPRPFLRLVVSNG